MFDEIWMHIVEDDSWINYFPNNLDISKSKTALKLPDIVFRILSMIKKMLAKTVRLNQWSDKYNYLTKRWPAIENYIAIFPFT